MTADGKIMDLFRRCHLLVYLHILYRYNTYLQKVFFVVDGGCCVGEGLWLEVWLGVGPASVAIAVCRLQRYFDAVGLLGETGAQCF
jgi:hypothetical protein